ncbi:hypothetical protein BC351_14660 [Paenibacillus ferrarius]|uniref:Uncharacterized protein n=1 Tax=Paenibacillus ferrarius TaxID=1469647 RepID=A0A1V4H6H2_9BACL|nr:hypothetical protein BC351_14660 [Paenibacillus ferrarius]
MMADAFSTAFYLMGLDQGRTLLEQVDLKGILISSDYVFKKSFGMSLMLMSSCGNTMRRRKKQIELMRRRIAWERPS